MSTTYRLFAKNHIILSIFSQLSKKYNYQTKKPWHRLIWKTINQIESCAIKN